MAAGHATLIYEKMSRVRQQEHVAAEYTLPPWRYDARRLRLTEWHYLLRGYEEMSALPYIAAAYITEVAIRRQREGLSSPV